jgi:hypothetical protein
VWTDVPQRARTVRDRVTAPDQHHTATETYVPPM